MNKLGITPGTHVSISKDRIIDSEGNTIVSCAYGEYKQSEIYTEFIQEAFTVANETGLSPLQLKEQRDELLELLRQSVEEINKLKYHYRDVKHSDEYLHKATSVINNCENTLNQPPSPHTNNN